MLAMLIGCGLRRAELLCLTLESIQRREEHWVIADLVGKGGHVRTVPIPSWVKDAVDVWTTAVGITQEQCSVRSTRQVGCGAKGCLPKCSGTWFGRQPLAPASRGSHRTIFDGRAPGSAT
jgi:integrase